MSAHKRPDDLTYRVSQILAPVTRVRVVAGTILVNSAPARVIALLV